MESELQLNDKKHNQETLQEHEHVQKQLHNNESILDSSITRNLSFEERKQQCFMSIENMLTKYKDNEMALSKIQSICTDILTTIDAYMQQQSNREEKLNKLRERSESFITSFLDTTPQYYYFQNNTFVVYDGEKYVLTSEDNISNRIVMLLSNDNELACRKHKIKSTIIKRIRDRGTSLAVPSSQTIQNVLHPLYPSVFETRNETKYFLTIIGDVLAKKPCELTYFVHHRAKEFIDYLLSGLTFLKASSASSLSTLFKYKFQNHAFLTSRIIRIQGSGDTLYYPNINILDVFFVAQYYSNRYGNADSLLQQMSFNNVAQHAMILANLENEKNIVEWFAKEAFVQNSNSNSNSNSTNNTETQSWVCIDVKTIQFMWKRFCQKMKIPNVIQSNAIIPLLLEIEPYKNAYDKDLKCFIGYSGNKQYNPAVGLFNEFWDDTITTFTQTENADYEFKQLEIDELAILFNSWVRKRGIQNSRNGFSMLDEDEIISCIKHFYPFVDIENGKYLNGVSCSLWDKQKDVFDYIETQIGLTQQTSDYLYRAYCNRTLRTQLCVASKGYFEKAYNHIV